MTEQGEGEELESRGVREALRVLPAALPTLFLGVITVRALLARVGHPAGTLDDSYIHFQYARAIVEGHPMRYQGGEPISSGATSQLWPALLAPFYAMGFRGEAILWPAWGLSFLALAGLAYEAWAIARGLVSQVVAVAAAAMVLTFGGHLWCAASGMEVVPFAWLLARSARRASEWAEGSGARTGRRLGELVALAIAAPLMRPEGAIVPLLVALVVAWHPRRSGPRGRAEALLPLLGLLITPLLLLAMTGKLTTSTTQVKLAVGNPYHPLLPTFQANARLLVNTLLNGEVWSAEFLPRGGAGIALMSLVAVVARGAATRRPVRAVAVLAFALAMFAPCAYVTFLWNRLRYLWPFATGWLVALACLAEVIGSLLSRVRRSYAVVAPLVGFGIAGMLSMKLDGVIDDVANSASGIDRQHVKVGKWVKAHLPEDARIGLNDTGAIAYFGDRRTFDIVGLTTPSEARYWLGGAGSRLEHYERLARESPSRLPSHFAVYPEWMACEPVLGKELFDATVTDSTILGGRSMRVFVADYTKLGSGELPVSPLPDLVDTLDVADLESEAEHRYELLGASEGEQTAESGPAGTGKTLIDGGRTGRIQERFVARLRPHVAHLGVVRARGAGHGDGDLVVRVFAKGREIGRFTASTADWTEESFPIPADVAEAETPLVLAVSGGTLATFHYWFAAR